MSNKFKIILAILILVCTLGGLGWFISQMASKKIARPAVNFSYDGIASINGVDIKLKDIGGGYFKSDQAVYVGYFCCPVMGSAGLYKNGWVFRLLPEADYGTFAVVDKEKGIAGDRNNEYKLLSKSLIYLHQLNGQKLYDYATISQVGDKPVYFVDKNEAFYQDTPTSTPEIISNDPGSFVIFKGDTSGRASDNIGMDREYVYFYGTPVLGLIKYNVKKLPLFDQNLFTVFPYFEKQGYRFSRFFSNHGQIYFIPLYRTEPILIGEADNDSFEAVSENQAQDYNMVFTYNSTTNKIIIRDRLDLTQTDNSSLLQKAKQDFIIETLLDGSICLSPSVDLSRNCSALGGSIRRETILISTITKKEVSCWSIARTADAAKNCRINSECDGQCQWLAGKGIWPNTSATCSTYKKLIYGLGPEAAILKFPLCENK
ncbi:MAG: hypothetical protein WCO55_05130 [Candidatus Falkowbacteria bacterium]